MKKTASFWLILLILTFCFPVKAQETGISMGEFDPLEERFKADNAYIPNYRELMREIVIAFGQYAIENNPGFQVITEGGQELLIRGEWENNLDDLHRAEMAGAKTDDEMFLLKLFAPEHEIPAGSPIRRYATSINGILLTNQVCSGGKGGLSDQTEKIVREFGLSVIGAEHCSTETLRDNAVRTLARKKIPAHADTDAKGLFHHLPDKSEPFLENPANIFSLAKVRNILMLTDTREFSDKDLLVKTLGQTNYDLLIVDPFFKSSVPLTKEDVRELQTKKVGSKRLVFAALNVSTAQDTRPYWEEGWIIGKPEWLRFQSKTDPSGVIVNYWHSAWKKILGVYFKSIMDLGFDGILLRGVDEHKTFEKLIPID